jgi:hypothetical protein
MNEKQEFPSLNAELKEKLKEALMSTKAHGLDRLVTVKSTPLQLVWLVFICTSISACGYLVVNNILNYLKFEVTTSIKDINEPNSKFPTVTLCHLNPYQTDYAIAYLQQAITQQTSYSSLPNIFDNATLKHLSASVIANVENLYGLYGNKYAATLNSTEKKKLSYDIKDFMLSCQFVGFDCNMSQFEWFYHSTYGNCYKFNSGVDSQGQAIHLKSIATSSVNLALTMDMFFGLPDELRVMSSGDGMAIFIHNSSVSPLNVNPIYLQGATQTYIQVARTFTNKLPQPYSECQLPRGATYESDLYNLIVDSGFEYTQLDCDSQCFQKYLIKTCNCSSTYLSLIYNVSVCTSELENNCSIGFYRSFTSDFLKEHCSPACPLECETQTFAYFLSTMGYPTSLQLDVYAQDERVQRLYFNKSFSSSLKSNIVSVSINYGKLAYTLIEEEPKLDVVTMLSNIGGALGLFLGISVLTFVELLEALIRIGASIFNYNRTIMANRKRAAALRVKVTPDNDDDTKE